MDIGFEGARQNVLSKDKNPDNLQSYIKDDIVEHLAFSSDFKYLMACTVHKEMTCYSLPKYEKKWKCKVELNAKISNIQHPDIPLPPTCISSIALHKNGLNFAVGLVTGHILLYVITIRP